ncbi:hypothetical protein LEWO105114_11145 [Legionella worsleiensis]|uniref:Uncharacterized protein n=1 Tax=Legionella worsleiensis TaxID=45076 RepID=A0A0W1A987_9GAMM|nr:hypothetical protein Lwor_1762 [Legionella worsleiensis]STY33125.1 Uncharacterised protein [Legionella worsleiensis]
MIADFKESCVVELFIILVVATLTKSCCLIHHYKVQLTVILRIKRLQQNVFLSAALH